MKQKDVSIQNPLGTAPVGRLLAQFAVPSVVSMLVNAVYNIVDQIFIGQGVNYLGITATTIAFPIVSIVLAVATMLGAGGSAYASIKLGEKRDGEARRTYGNVFIISIGAGILIMILGLLFLDPMLRLFGASDEAMEYSRQYTSIILLGAPFNVLGVSLSNLARADGHPRLSMYSILAGAVLNTILDPIYIFVFHWGVVGAAIATSTSQLISAGVLVWYFARKSKMKLTRESMRPSGRILKQVAALGFSSSVLQIANTITQIVMNNSLSYYGSQNEVGADAAIAAVGTVLKTNMIIISICIGIGIGSQPILGFNRGAGKPRRIRHTFLLAAVAATSVSTLGWAACQLFPGPILSIFGTQDDVFSSFAVHSMRLFLGGVFFAGLQIVSTSYFQATGQPVKATALSLLRQILLLLPLVLILPLWFGLDGILYAGMAADIASGIVVSIFLIVEMRRLSRWIAQSEGAGGAEPSSETALSSEDGPAADGTAV